MYALRSASSITLRRATVGSRSGISLFSTLGPRLQEDKPSSSPASPAAAAPQPPKPAPADSPDFLSMLPSSSPGAASRKVDRDLFSFRAGRPNSSSGGLAPSSRLFNGNNFARRAAGAAGGSGGAQGGVPDYNAPIAPSEIPRTGVYAGRTVAIDSEADLPRALRNLNSMNAVNQVRQTSLSQTKFVRPGKVKQRILIERRKRKFKQNVKRMFELVAEARRKGY